MEGVIALFIPIVGTVGSFALVALIVFWALKSGDKKRKLEHEQRMFAIEKGVDIPMAPPKEYNPYKWPFILIAIGIGTMIGLFVLGNQSWVWGLVLMLVGGGMLIAHSLFTKQKNQKETTTQSVETSRGTTDE